MRDIDWDRYSDVPDDVVKHLVWCGERCYAETMENRNRLKDKCQTLMIFLSTGFIGIVGYILSTGVTRQKIPLIIYSSVLLALIGVMFWMVVAVRYTMPYQPPYDRYQFDADDDDPADVMAYERWQLIGYDRAIDDASDDCRRLSLSFNISLSVSVLSSCVLLFVYVPCPFS